MDQNPYESPQALSDPKQTPRKKRPRIAYYPVAEVLFVIAIIAWLVYMATRPTVGPIAQ